MFLASICLVASLSGSWIGSCSSVSLDYSYLVQPVCCWHFVAVCSFTCKFHFQLWQTLGRVALRLLCCSCLGWLQEHCQIPWASFEFACLCLSCYSSDCRSEQTSYCVCYPCSSLQKARCDLQRLSYYHSALVSQAASQSWSAPCPCKWLGQSNLLRSFCAWSLRWWAQVRVDHWIATQRPLLC